MKLLQQSEEHRDHLQRLPLTGLASDYLIELSVQMTTLGDVTISEQRARSICSSVSVRLRASGQIAAVPEPASVLNALCAHHVLERLEYISIPTAAPACNESNKINTRTFKETSNLCYRTAAHREAVEVLRGV